MAIRWQGAVIFLVLTKLCLAQQYNFKRLTVREGLAQNQCRAMLVDTYNNLWVATYEGGLCKYDGQNFSVITVRNGLPSNVLYDLAQDSAQNIWVATAEGLAFFDGFRIKTISQSKATRIHKIQIAPTGKIWFLTDNGISYLNREKVQVDLPREYQPNGIRNFLLVGQDSLLILDNNSRVWLFGASYLHLLAWEGKALSEVRSIVSPTPYQALIFSPSGVFTFHRTLYKDPELQKLTGLAPRSALRDAFSNLWLGNSDGAHVLFANGKLLEMSEVNGLSGVIEDICEDKEKGVWFASSFGVFRYRDTGFAHFGMAHGLADRYISSLAVDKYGRLWFTSSKGLQYLEDGQVFTPKGIPEALRRSPRPVLLDAKRNLVVGHPTGIYTQTGNSFRRTPFPKGLSDRLVCGIVLRNGNLLFGGSQGLWLFNGQKIQRFHPEVDVTINSLAQSSFGIWVATEGLGLMLIAPDTLYHFTKETGPITSNIINSLAIDHKGDLWGGTSGNGLFKIKNAAPDGQYVNFEHLDLASSNVYSLLVDDTSNLWAGTDHGITRLTILQNDHIIVKNIGAQDGFTPVEVYHGSVAKQGGYLWFGTVEGITRVSAKARLSAERPPYTFLKEILLFQNKPNWSNYTSKIDRWTGVPLSGSLHLPPSENYISFKFVATSHNQAENIRYFWMIQGYDQHWNGPSPRGEATYTNLPPGSYTFRVKSCSSSGICDDHAIVYQFSISRPFYKTRWFWLITFLVVIVGVIAFYSRRLEALRQERAESKIRQRQRELEMRAQTEQFNKQSRQLKRAMAELDRINATLLSINNELTASLSYARRILNIILSAPQNLSRYFPDSFYYDRPRKIVSGDYVWTYHYPPYTYVALVDCTASGVSAAFLSIMADSVLSKVAESYPNATPSQLLTAINQRICEIMRPETENRSDGIDMAICRFESGTYKMLFSGAKSAVHYWENGEIVTLKGDFFSLGLEFEGVESDFRDIEVQLPPDTMVYFYTSGYANQLGGPETKRFKSLRLKDLLCKIKNLDPKEQQTILDMEFQNWIGSNPQMEDVLVVGFRPFPIDSSTT